MSGDILPLAQSIATGRAMDQKSGKPSQKRRAILQGSLAAPVVLTVPSPSAATQTTLGRCLANLDDPTITPPPKYLVSDPAPAGDTWLRVQVPVFRLKEPGPNGSIICEFAFKDDALAAANPLDLYKAYRTVAAPHSQVTFTMGQQHNFDAVSNGTVRGLQWVDELSKTASNKIQIERPGSGYRHATGTCWSSFVRSA